MTTTALPIESLSDSALLAATVGAASAERHAIGRLVALLSEVDERRLYLGQGCSSLFTYCTQVLHLSEHAAYGRIEAARAGRRFPLVLERLVSGELTLTAVGLLRQHLTPENHRELLDAARHKSRRDIEELVAKLAPRPPVPNVIRRLPAPPTGLPTTPSFAPPALPPTPPLTPSADAPVAPSPQAARAVVESLAPERYKVQLTISADTREKLRQLQALLRHQVPDGDLAVIVDRAISVLLAQVQRSKLAATARPRDDRRQSRLRSRHVPASVKREVWSRDKGRCAFVGEQGVAPRPDFSSSITSSPSRGADRRRWRTSSCGAGVTTPTRRRSALDGLIRDWYASLKSRASGNSVRTELVANEWSRADVVRDGSGV